MIRSSHWPGLLSWLPAVLAPFILFSPLLLGGQAMFWGTPFLQFVPWWWSAWQALAAGHLPLWNPLVGMGAPLLANYQTALFYPPTWIYFGLAALGGITALAWGQALLAFLHLAWGGLGMACLARRVGFGRLGAGISGLAFGMCGYCVARASFLSINATAAWTPWVLLGITSLADPMVEGRRQRRAFAGLTACLAFQLLAGHAQTTWYTLLLAGVWTFYWGWQAGGWRKQLRLLTLLVLALLLASAIAAVQLLPTAEYLAQSQRAVDYGFDQAMTYSLWPWRLFGFFVPNMFGNPVHGDYWGYATYWEDAVYIGLLPALLALAALFSKIRLDHHHRTPGLIPERAAKRSFTFFLIAIAFSSILLALGKNTPVFPWLYWYVPTFSLFQAPARWLLWGEVVLALLAGLGAREWRRPEKRSLYWTRLGTAGALAVCLGAGLAWVLLGKVSPTFVRAATLAGLWGIGAGALSLLAPPRLAPGDPPWKWEELWHWSVILFVSVDLVVAGWGLTPGFSLALYQRAPATLETLRNQQGSGRLYLSPGAEQELKFKRFLKFTTFDPGENWLNLRAVLLPNTNVLDGLPSANNFDPLLPARYSTWLAELDAAPPDRQEHMLALMNVTLVEQVGLSTSNRVRFEPVRAAGRSRWVPCALLASGPEMALQLASGAQPGTGRPIDNSRYVILELPGSPLETEKARNLTCEPGGKGTVEAFSEQGPNRLDLQVRADAPGWVVISQTWYPGWQASLDGLPTAIRRADYLFQAVALPAGEHRLELVYDPASFRLGAWISLIGLVVFLLLGWSCLRR